MAARHGAQGGGLPPHCCSPSPPDPAPPLLPRTAQRAPAGQPAGAAHAPPLCGRHGGIWHQFSTVGHGLWHAAAAAQREVLLAECANTCNSRMPSILSKQQAQAAAPVDCLFAAGAGLPGTQFTVAPAHARDGSAFARIVSNSWCQAWSGAAVCGLWCAACWTVCSLELDFG